MLRRERYARDVLLVCDTYKSGELADLAQQFRNAVLPSVPTSTAPAAGHAHRPTEWSRHTSGFGVSRPMEAGDEQIGTPNDGRLATARRLMARWWQR